MAAQFGIGCIRKPIDVSELEAAILAAYARLGGGEDEAVAVRSSATAEDLPGASFAGATS